MAKSKQSRWTSSGVIYPSYLWEKEMAGSGGAIYLNNKSSSLTGGGDETDYAYFIGNTATSNGGAVAITGASSSGSLEYLYFEGNTGGTGGALICNGTNISVTIANTVFRANRASQGGAIFNGASLTLTNVLFDGNEATNGSGTKSGAIWN